VWISKSVAQSWSLVGREGAHCECSWTLASCSSILQTCPYACCDAFWSLPLPIGQQHATQPCPYFGFIFIFRGVRKNCEKRLLASSCLPVRPSEWNNSAPTGRVFMKFCMSFSNEKIQVSLKSDKKNECFTWRPMYIYDNTGYTQKNGAVSLYSPLKPHHSFVYTLYIAEFFLEWEIFQTKVVEKIKIHILCSITFFRKSCRLWDYVEKYGTARQATDDNIIRRMRFACWVTKAAYTHSKYVILIAFPRQQWLRERAWILQYTVYYITCLVYEHTQGLDTKPYRLNECQLQSVLYFRVIRREDGDCIARWNVGRISTQDVTELRIPNLHFGILLC
jgi:hypothetical protein